MTDIIIIAAILIIIGAATFYILRSKKKGKKCIGCPYGASCEKNKNCNCSSD